MADASARRAITRPTLHHFGLTTANLEAMVQWYANVLGMVPNHRSSPGQGSPAGSYFRAAWLSNDQANHRLVIMELRGLTDDPRRSCHTGLHHFAFEYATLDDLLATYVRLKGLGIKPVLAADQGATTSFYYEDPDRNRVELLVDNFSAGEQSSAFMRSSPDFAANPMGAYVDPGLLVAARAAGVSVAELHERAYAGEFCGPSGFYRHSLVTAAARSAAG